ncbi:MAG: 16S rRNA (cytosine967-C5)-methyltransferase [Candidatus Binatia bacterium]
MQRQKPRTIAHRVLQNRENGKDYTENLFRREIAEVSPTPQDRALAQELTYGAARWQNTLDWLIDRKTDGRKQKQNLRLLLRLGLYQIFWLDRIPDHAAVHEIVELSKELGCAPQAGFLNAVLRDYVREKDMTHKLLNDLRYEDPPQGWSHPEDLCARWRERWGDDRLFDLLKWNNTPPPTYARINTLRAEPKDIEAMWWNEGVEARPAPLTWENIPAYQLESHPSLESLESFRDGKFYVQDPSTIAPVIELDPQPGETILDLCAAPGGKTTLIAQLMNNQGKVLAADISPDRLKQVAENCVRLGVTCVESLVADETLNAKLADLSIDRILIDAPCSNTGVIRRRVDARWRAGEKEIAELREIQLQLLKKAAKWIKPGGRIVYSTCSLEPEENRGVIAEFLKRHRKFRLDSDRQLLPFDDQVDGGYSAVLKMTE